MGHKIGLVLSGGGAKGAYEVGVYKALEEYGVTKYIDGIMGTSVGALNAALFSSCGIECAERIWEDLKWSDLLHLSWQHVAQIVVNVLIEFIILFAPIPGKGVRATYALKVAIKCIEMLRKARNIEAARIAVAAIPWAANLFEFLWNGGPISQERIQSLIDEEIDLGRLKKDIYVICKRVKSDEPRYLSLNIQKMVSKNRGRKERMYECFSLPSEIRSKDDHNPGVRARILCASSAIPYLYTGKKGVEVLGKRYVDGGFGHEGNNTPYRRMRENVGYRDMIVVHLTHEPCCGTPQIWGMGKLVHIIPSESIDSPIIHKESLVLTKKKTKKLIQMGYDDTVRKLPEIYQLVERHK